MPVDCARCGKTVQDKRALRGHIRMAYNLDDEEAEELFQRSIKSERPNRMDALEEYAIACKMEECLEEVQPDELTMYIAFDGEYDEVDDYDKLKEDVQKKKQAARNKLVGGGE